MPSVSFFTRNFLSEKIKTLFIFEMIRVISRNQPQKHRLQYSLAVLFRFFYAISGRIERKFSEFCLDLIMSTNAVIRSNKELLENY